MRPAALVALGLMVVGLAGCSDAWSVGLALRSDPPLEPDLSRGEAVIAEGMAVGVRAVPLEDDEPVDDDDLVVELTSLDRDVVDVRPGLDPNTFVLIGRRAGTARLDARVDGEVAAPLEVVVEAQAPPAP